MSEEIHFSVIGGVRAVVNLLTDDEVVALNLAIGTNPTGVMGYDKITTLFTEENETKMHHDTKQAFMALLNERLKTIL